MPRPQVGPSDCVVGNSSSAMAGAEQDIANNAQIKHAFFMTDYLWGRSAHSLSRPDLHPAYISKAVALTEKARR